MNPDAQDLFAPRPLAERALRLQFDEAAPPAWFVATDAADLARLPAGQFLAKSEQTRSEAFKFKPPREHFVLGRLAAKLALSAMLKEPRLERLEISNDAKGAPLVAHPREAGAGVSISHTDGKAVALAYPSDFPMGVDLETIDAARSATVQNELKLSPPESAWLTSGQVDMAAGCLLIWAAREALGKLLHCGLSCPWEELALGSVESDGQGRWVCRYLRQPALECHAWHLGSRMLAIAAATQAEVV